MEQHQQLSECMTPDVINNIMNNENVKILWQLYQTDKTIQNLCDKYSFHGVLIRFCQDDFFKQDIKSVLSHVSLNNITYNDRLILKQLSLGTCLIGESMISKIIIFVGLYTF